MNDSALQDAHQESEPARTPDEVELVLQLGSARDFAAGCRELIDMADELAARTDARSPSDVAADAARHAGIPPDVQRQVQGVFAQAEQQANAMVGAALDGDHVAADEWAADPFAVFARIIRPEGLVAQLATRLRTEFDGQPGIGAYMAAYGAATFRRPRKPLLLRALLAAVCGRVEVSVLRVLRRDLLTHGSYSGIGDPQLEDEVRKLMRGGLEKWRCHLSNRVGIDIAAGSADWSLVIELFERRHVLVHREGLVDHRYRTQVRDAPAPGTSLEPTSTYLRQVVDLCETVTVGLVTQLLARRRPEFTQELSVVTLMWAEEAVEKSRWLCAESYHGLSGVLTDDPLAVERRRVEGWLDRQERLGVDATRDEIAGWDTEALPPEFGLARLVLLGEDEAGRRVLAQLRVDGLISDQAVDEWRLFRRWHDQGLLR